MTNHTNPTQPTDTPETSEPRSVPGTLPEVFETSPSHSVHPSVVHFHAGSNMPGYLSDSDEPATFETFRDAAAYLIDELDRAGDHIFSAGEDEDERAIADSYSAAMEDLNLSSGPEWSENLPTSTSEHDLGRNWWVIRCENDECMTEVFEVNVYEPGTLPDFEEIECETFEEAVSMLVEVIGTTSGNVRSWDDEPQHDCDDVPCPTYGDDCPWQRAAAIDLAADEVEGWVDHGQPSWSTLAGGLWFRIRRTYRVPDTF